MLETARWRTEVIIADNYRVILSVFAKVTEGLNFDPKHVKVWAVALRASDKLPELGSYSEICAGNSSATKLANVAKRRF